MWPSQAVRSTAAGGDLLAATLRLLLVLVSLLHVMHVNWRCMLLMLCWGPGRQKL